MKKSLLKSAVSLGLISTVVLGSGLACLADEETDISEDPEILISEEEEDCEEVLSDEYECGESSETEEAGEEILFEEEITEDIEVSDEDDSDVLYIEFNIGPMNFPDAKFRTYISDVIDTDGSGGLSSAELNAVTEMRVNGKGISKMDGISFFKNMYLLDCSDNNISSIDITYCKSLEMLYISGNPLTELDISSNPRLSFVYEYGKKKSQGGIDAYSMNGLIYLYVDDDVNIISSVPSDTGWVKSGNKWKFKNYDGEFLKNKVFEIKGKYYAFDSNGYMTTGWTKINNKWYYSESNGVLLKGWQKLSGKWYYFSTDSVGPFMATGWKVLSGKTYYFNDSGAMVTGWQKLTCYGKNGYFYFDSNGVVLTGWQTIGGKKYYLDPVYGGLMVTGTFTVDGVEYTFESSGALKNSYWEKIGELWAYVGSDGTYVEGWQKIGGKWYYFIKEGDAFPYMSTGWLYLDGEDYYFSDSGAMVTGWYQFPDHYEWLYFGTDGALKNGWQKISGKWYYFDDSDGTLSHMFTGWLDYKDKEYYFDEDGIMVTGWYDDDGTWRYFGTDGVLRWGWQKINGYWYYLDDEANCFMNTDISWIGDDFYYFGTDGKMRTNIWVDWEGDWLYFGSDGKAVLGWHKIGGYYYYFDGDYHAMCYEEWVKTDGKWYYVDSDGHMVTSCTIKIEGKNYTFDSSGVCKNP
ncbi:MAG: hypothetical protein J5883_01195 [Clostridiales bacterium]|nr:hypothetical protein [Clostridiales bacterium]